MNFMTSILKPTTSFFINYCLRHEKVSRDVSTREQLR